MTRTHAPLPYWDRFVRPRGGWRTEPGPPPGEDLAALRAGLGREPGTVIAMWPFYASPSDDRLAARGLLTFQQQAEHAALALFGLHQQSQDRPMHQPHIGVGQALRELRDSGRYSEPAVDSRVNAAATSTSPRALLVQLRGLITQLRTIGQPLDYNLLQADLHDFHWPDSRSRVRLRWGLAYYGWRPASASATAEASAGQAPPD